jgi:hypothetical protein
MNLLFIPIIKRERDDGDLCVSDVNLICISMKKIYFASCFVLLPDLRFSSHVRSLLVLVSATSVLQVQRFSPSLCFWR